MYISGVQMSVELTIVRLLTKGIQIIKSQMNLILRFASLYDTVSGTSIQLLPGDLQLYTSLEMRSLT